MQAAHLNASSPFEELSLRPSARTLAEQAFSRAAGAPLISGNRVQLLKNAAQNYPAWLRAIASARDHVHFESYIIHEDGAGVAFANALIAKAQEGVRVRLIYDWMGGLGKTSRTFWNRLRTAGEVRHEILMLPYFDVFDNITFKVEGYNVTLLGQVTRPTLKTDAERIVKRVEGVEKVDNQIEVLPVSNSDDRLRIRLFRAIDGYSALQRYALPVIKPIRIIVKNGHVTLEGVVDSEADKNLVNMRARGVSGSFSVTNNLLVSAS